MKQLQAHQPKSNPIMEMPPTVWREYIGPKASLFDQVETLPEDEKLVLALHYYEGLSFSEIGFLMKVKEWDAVVLHTQALMKLQSKVQDIFLNEE
jgi:DNA-directed RNA polymerase specialized sigma subunit